MTAQLHTTEISYPDSDGNPMADNTKQFEWIVLIKKNLDLLFRDHPDVFVAGDLLWYPVKGNPKIRTAPDALVAFGRPKGDRGSYKQWEEADIPPQVVFEILSPGNTLVEMERKLLFYDRYGVEEYYIYDPDANTLRGWLRNEYSLDAIESMANWHSPRLGIRFDLSSDELQIFHPDGTRFLSFIELAQEIDQEQQRADQEQQARLEAIPRLLQLGLTNEQVAEALGLSIAAVQSAVQSTN
jgi:Uma2 family endonuclease